MTEISFNPYSPPASSLDDEQGKEGVWRDKRRLIMQDDAILPNRCCRCNAEEPEVHLTIRVFWTYPGYSIALIAVIFVPVVGWVLFLLGGLLLIIMRVRNNTRVEYAICRKHNRLRLGLLATGMSMLTSSLVLSVWILKGTKGWAIDPSELAIFVAGGFVLLGAIFAAVGQALFRISVKRYIDHKIWLGGFGKPFIAALEPFLPENQAKKT